MLTIKRPSLPDGSVQNVPPGSVRGFRAGVYVNQDMTVTFQTEGDSAIFRIVAVETDDVVFIDDPDVPHKHVATLQTAIRQSGAGPIAVSADQAIIVDVEFSCPPDPQKIKFTATLTSPEVSIPVSATANIGSVTGNVITAPADLVAGEPGNFGLELFSSLGHPVVVAVTVDTNFDPHFSGPVSGLVTVPAAGGVAHLTLPITCVLGTAEGTYQVGFKFLAQDGTPFTPSLGFGTQVRVIAGTVATTIEKTSVVMVGGGIAPINVRVQSLRGGGTDVSYSLVGPSSFGLSGTPIHVDSGSTARGTVWLEAGADAPQDATLQLNQFSFSTQGELLPAKLFVSVLPAPPADRFVVLRIYWGPKWSAGIPFSWQQMENAIFHVIRSNFPRGLVEYGVGSIGDVAVISTPGLPTVVPAFAIEPTFPASNDFDDSDVTALIVNMIESNQLPRPDQLQGTPFYYVMPQQGSFYRPDREGILGEHGTFSFAGADHLYAWGYQGGDVAGTSPTFGHELVEALSGKVAGMEVGDPCEQLSGTVDGVSLQPYFSKQQNLCVLPDMSNNPDVAATPAIPGKTGR